MNIIQILNRSYILSASTYYLSIDSINTDTNTIRIKKNIGSGSVNLLIDNKISIQKEQPIILLIQER
jgi:hypothetical protein